MSAEALRAPARQEAVRTGTWAGLRLPLRQAGWGRGRWCAPRAPRCVCSILLAGPGVEEPHEILRLRRAPRSLEVEAGRRGDRGKRDPVGHTCRADLECLTERHGAQRSPLTALGRDAGVVSHQHSQTSRDDRELERLADRTGGFV